MKLLAIFFILGLALASAVPLSSDDDIETELDQITDELGDEFIIYAEGGLAQRLRERLEELIQKIKNAFDEGKGVNDNLMKRAEEFYEKLKNLGFEISEKFQKIFEELKSKIGRNAPHHADFDIKEILRKLREKIRENIDIDKIREQIKDRLGKSELGKQLLELFKDSKAKDKIRDFINRILGDKETVYLANFGFIDKLKEQFEQLVEKMKKSMDEGKGVSENMMKKAQDFYDKLTNLHVEISDKVKQIFEDIKSKMPKSAVEHAEVGLVARLRERLENLISRMKKDVDDGKGVKGDLFKKLTDVYEKFKNMGFELSDKFKKIFEDLKSRVSRTRSVENADFNLFEIFRKLKQLIKDKFDVDDLKAKVEKLFGKGSEIAEQLITILKEKGEKGKKGIVDWIDRILGEKEEEKRSIKEIYEKLKKYFKDLNIELKEKFLKFGEYIKDKYEKVLDKTKSDIENVKKIAEKFVADGRKISKDLAEEALEFFRDYRDDLGTIWVDIRDKVQDIRNGKD